MTSSMGQHRVRVLQGKGRKQRWTAISEVALEALRGYLDGFRGWSDGPLFQTVDGRPLRNHHMNVMFTRHGMKAGVRQVNPPPVPAHVCDVGDTSQCAGAGRAVLVGALKPNDGEAVFCHLRLRAGGEVRTLHSALRCSWLEKFELAGTEPRD